VEQQALRNLDTAKKITGLYEQMKTPFTEVLSSKWSINEKSNPTTIA
jgi:hypothetical protein